MISPAGILKGIALFILSFLLFTSLTSWVFLGAFLGTALDPVFVSEKIKESNVHDFFLQSIMQGQIQGQPGFISEQEMKNLFTASFSKEWFDSQISTAVSNSFAYLKSEKADFTASIDFTQVKQNMATELNKKIKEIEVQTGASIGTISPDSLGFPDSLDLAQAFPEEALSQARFAVSFLLASLNYLLILAVICLALIALIHRNLKHTLKWFGGNLAVSGATLLVLAYFLPSTVSSALNSQMPSQQQQVLQAILPFLLDFFKTIADKTSFYAIIFLVTGIILYVVGRFVIGRFILKEKKAPATKEKTKPKK